MVPISHDMCLEVGPRVGTGLPSSQWEEGNKINLETHSASQGNTNTQLRKNVSIAVSGAGEKFPRWIVKSLDRVLVRR